MAEDEASQQGGFTALQGSSDVQAMFTAKRRHGRKGQGLLSFRFDSSRHAISINTYMKEQRDIELAEVRSHTRIISFRTWNKEEGGGGGGGGSTEPCSG